jgi:hypothetical protein
MSKRAGTGARLDGAFTIIVGTSRFRPADAAARHLE